MRLQNDNNMVVNKDDDGETDETVENKKKYSGINIPYYMIEKKKKRRNYILRHILL